MNPNNCSTCEYMAIRETGKEHCYMFRDEPNEVCMQHTGRKSLLNPPHSSLMGLLAEIVSLQPVVECGKCSRLMSGTTAYDGACDCGGFIKSGSERHETRPS